MHCSAHYGREIALRPVGRLLAVSLLALAIAGCSVKTSVSSSSPEADATSPIPRAEGRELADRVANGLIEGNVAAVYEVMNQPFRDSTPLAEFDPSYLYQASGTPLEVEFKMDDAGTTMMPWGEVPMRKYWYATRTTEYQKGTFFLFIEVVENGAELECAQFSVVSFAGEVPPQLQ
jgi:hypothetical protein